MQTRKASLEIPRQYRFLSIAAKGDATRASAIDEEARTVELAFSSEFVVQRWFGSEVLDHSAAAVDLGRLNDGGAVLWNHDTDGIIGVVEAARVDGDRVARARIRFGTSDKAEQIWRDVVAGVIRHVSVGYEINELTIENPDTSAEAYRATRWTPLEISLVSVPADPTVGLGRAKDASARAVPVIDSKRSETTTHQPEIIIVSDNTTKTAEPGDEVFKKRVAGILRLAEAYAAFIKPGDEARAIADGADLEAFQEKIMQRMQSGVTDVTAKSVGATTKELARYSLINAIRAQLPANAGGVAPGFEMELSRAMAKALGRDPEGMFVPPEFFSGKRDFLAGTSSQAGNLIQTDVMDSMFTDVLRPALVLGRLGITILPGLRSNVAIPRKTVAGTLAMLTEVAGATETQPTTAQATLSPKRVSAFVEPSKQAIIQGEVGIEAMLRDDLLSGAAVKLEDQGINGTGTSGEATGIRTVSGIGAVVGGTNGAALAWSHVTGLEAACANANAAATAKAGYLMNTKTVNTAKNTQKAANLPFIWDNGEMPLNGYRAGITNNVPSTLTKGTAVGTASAFGFSSDWSMFCLGLFGGLDVTVDPYTLATTGQLRITLNQFFDWACRQPGAFAFSADILTP